MKSGRATPGRHAPASAPSGPPTLDELWSWAVEEASSITRDPPDQIHAGSGDRDDWGHARDHVIRGLPFTRRFEAYVSGRLPPVAIVRALRTLERVTPVQLRMHDVAAAVVAGERDRAALQGRLGLGDFAFSSIALNALLALRGAFERELARERRAA